MRAWPRTLLFAVALLAGPDQILAEQGVKLFSAASTTTAIDILAERYIAKHGKRITPVYAASSTLARQIVSGAPADIFLSANSAWMDYANSKGAVETRSRHNLLSNRLVLIAPSDSRLQVTLTPSAETPGSDLAALLGDGRLAIGDPDHVPAGIYAKSALQTLGLWQGLKGKLVFVANVRAALALADRGEVAAAVVYASDVGVSSGVRQVAVFPRESHSPVRYAMAIVAGRDRPEVRRVYEFLRSQEALAVFQAQGFSTGQAD